MEVNKYLERIGLARKEIKPDLNSLKLLQRNHLLNIPFENLDIHWKRKILLDEKLFAKKIIEEKRGGFCYELNGLFYQLLTELGFVSKIISARVSDGKGGFGEEYDHLAILTKIGKKEFLVDVGFGDFAAEPLEFRVGIEQEDTNGVFKIEKCPDDYFEVLKKKDEGRSSEYVFMGLERELSEFEAMCDYHQSSSKSHFTQKMVCSLMTENGRKTVTDKKFIETKDGVKKEVEINSRKEFDEVLEREFGIVREF